MQATVRTFDRDTGAGTVLCDDGRELVFDGAAFAASGLRRLRLGQRVRLELSERGAVGYLTIATLPR